MHHQGLLIDTPAKCAKELCTSKVLRSMRISDHSLLIPRTTLLPWPHALPLNACVKVTGTITEKSSIFKSNLFPLLLYFQCSDNSEFLIIFKDRDDMTCN